MKYSDTIILLLNEIILDHGFGKNIYTLIHKKCAIRLRIEEYDRLQNNSMTETVILISGINCWLNEALNQWKI